jgi:hypothetical protein
MTGRSAERAALAQDAVRAFLAQIPRQQALPGMPVAAAEGPQQPARADPDAAAVAEPPSLAYERYAEPEAEAEL